MGDRRMAFLVEPSTATELTSFSERDVYVVAFAIQTPNGESDFTQWWKDETRLIKHFSNEPDFPNYKIKNVYPEATWNRFGGGRVDVFVALIGKDPSWGEESISFQLLNRARQYNEDINFLISAKPLYTGFDIRQIRYLQDNNFLDSTVAETGLGLIAGNQNDRTLTGISENVAELCGMLKACVVDAWKSYKTTSATVWFPKEEVKEKDEL